MRALSLLPIWFVLAGCSVPGELRLELADVDPDPLEDGVTLRLQYHNGLDIQVIEVPLESAATEPSTGASGAQIEELLVEVLDGDDTVIARGWRHGDLTPTDGEIRTERILLLRTGEFSTVEGLELSAGRRLACIAEGIDGTVLVAGGGSADVDLLDLELGVGLTSGGTLSSPFASCQAAALNDGTLVVAGQGSATLDLLDVTSGTRLTAIETSRDDGALVALSGGQKVWWMGGTELGENLTSDLVSAGGDLEVGPIVQGLPRIAHRVGVAGDGEGLAVFGTAGDAEPWWQTTGQAVIQSPDGLTLDPSIHEVQPLAGRAMAVAAVDDSHVAGLAQLDDDPLDQRLYVFDVSQDVEAIEIDEFDAGLESPALVSRPQQAELWIIGGLDEQGFRTATQILSPSGNWLDPNGVDLQVARSEASALFLQDGRLVVVGGAGESGDLTSVEIYQP